MRHMTGVKMASMPRASSAPRMCPPCASGTQASHGMAHAVMRRLSRNRNHDTIAFVPSTPGWSDAWLSSGKPAVEKDNLSAA